MSLDVLLGAILGSIPLVALSIHVAREHLAMRREVERLRRELYDVRALSISTHEDFSAWRRIPLRTPNPFLPIVHDEPHGAPAPKPIVVESLGPPTPPPKGKGAYR